MGESATILASEVHWLESRHTGGRYRITVSLPYVYTKSRAEGGPFDNSQKAWPVVYLLDANWYFGMVTDTVRSMAWCGGTSDAIIVGIGYPEDDDAQEAWREAVVCRNRDFTPVRGVNREKDIGEWIRRPVQTGSAGQFHSFIKDELIPYIEQTYRTDPSRRILAGHSLAGGFALFALFEAPELFETYIIASPSPGNEDRYAFVREEAYAKDHTALEAKVFLSIGGLEESAENTSMTDMLRMAAILADRKYEGLSLVKRVFDDLNHCEVIGPAFHAGLMFALKKAPPAS